MVRQIIITLLILSFSFRSPGQSKDTVYINGDTVVLKRDTVLRNQLELVNFNRFLGKKVAALLRDTTVGKFKSYFWADEPPGVLSSLNLEYARGLYLTIYVYPVKHQSTFLLNGKWDLELYKKEKIADVRLDKHFFEKYVVNRHANH